MRVDRNSPFFISEDVTIIMTEVRFDTGGDYNTSTGIFTAPCSGIYEFTWTIFVEFISSAPRIALVVNQVTNIAHLSEFPDGSSTTTHTIIQLVEDDQVFLFVTNGNQGDASISSGDTTITMFAGSRLL